MSARLSLKSGVFWLQQQQKTTPSLHHPLLLFPGDGCEDVQVEAALLLACSPLLRRILPLSCCNSSAMTVVLPSITSASLKHLVEIVSQGSVKIASGELANFRDLLSLLEIDMDKQSSNKKVAAKRLREVWKLSPKARQRLCSPSPICSTSSSDSTLEDVKLVKNYSATSLGASSQGILEAKVRTSHSISPLPIRIPFRRFLFQTVPKIAAKQELPECLLPSSEASPKTKPLPASSGRPPVTCIFCDTTMLFGTDQNTYLQHLEVKF